MPVLIRHNEALELTRVDLYGKLLPEHVHGYGAYGLAHPHLVGFDTITFVNADVDISAITSAHVEAFFLAYGAMLRASDKMVRRRTGWVCDHATGQAALSQWLTKRNAGAEPDAHVRQFSSIEAVCEWLLLSRSASAALNSGEGFTELARFDGAAGAAR